MPSRGGSARRDRHGRGLRGPLAPPGLPLRLTRAQQFDAMVTESVGRLARRWAAQLDLVAFRVEDIPPPRPPGAADHPVGGDRADAVPLGGATRAPAGGLAEVVVYRRPVEARAPGGRAREDLVHLVVVDQLAGLWGVDPSTIDPSVEQEPDA